LEIFNLQKNGLFFYYEIAVLPQKKQWTGMELKYFSLTITIH